MYPRKKKIFIISELSPQNEGDIDMLKTMILQSKMGGADAVKLQVYNSINFLGDSRKEFSEITKKELVELKVYADSLSISLFGSAFDKERLQWLNDINVEFHKIPSKIYNRDKLLVKKALDSKKVTFISNGLDCSDFSFGEYDNARYFYCVTKYPAYVEDVNLPDFYNHPYYVGYSDHTWGLTAAKVAVSRGAKYIEKHFTLSKGMQSSVNKAHLGSMCLQELIELRSFCDDFVRMPIKEG